MLSDAFIILPDTFVVCENPSARQQQKIMTIHKVGDILLIIREAATFKHLN